MIKLEFTAEEVKNLLIFLNRVQLTGEESFAYVALIQKINETLMLQEGGGQDSE